MDGNNTRLAAPHSPATAPSRAAALFRLLTALALLATPAPAQPDDPALTDPSIAEQEAALANRRANPPTIMPAADPTVRTPLPGQPGSDEFLPGLSAEALGIPLGSLYAEGSFLVRRAGAMLQAPTGEWIFVFNPAPDLLIDTPMVLVPSAELENVLPTISQDQTPRPLIITGQVLVYASRNFLIPLSIIDGPASPPPSTEPPSDPSQPTPPTNLAADPDVASLIADLETQRNVPRGLAARTTVAPNSRESLLTPTSIETIPEGTMLVRRRARMVREGTGAWSLVLDNDSGQNATRLIILPCQALAEMERLATGATEEAEFEITARILTFQSRNYAMPLMFALLRQSDVRSLQ